MANNRATKSGFAAEAQRKVSTINDVTLVYLFLLFISLCRLRDRCVFTPIGRGTRVLILIEKHLHIFQKKLLLL
jgi:hypothetical protein